MYCVYCYDDVSTINKIYLNKTLWRGYSYSSQPYILWTSMYHPICYNQWFLLLFNIQLMMTSSNGNIFRVTGPLCGEFTGPRWIPRMKASDAELWCFLWSAPWINGCLNNGEAGESHYDVTVMYILKMDIYIYVTHEKVCFIFYVLILPFTPLNDCVIWKITGVKQFWHQLYINIFVIDMFKVWPYSILVLLFWVGKFKTGRWIHVSKRPLLSFRVDALVLTEATVSYEILWVL